MRTSLVSLVSATALVGALGCGKVASNVDAGSNIDANGSDGMVSIPDANVDAQTHGPVNVIVYQSGAVAPGIPVYYHEVDGSYIGSVTTDANGEATISDMPVGGIVTVPVNPYDTGGLRANGIGFGGNFIASITGVQVGDTLTFGKAQQFPSGIFGGGNSIGTVNITMPGAVGGATRYYAHIPCTDTSTSTAGASLSLSPREGCVSPTNQIPVLAYAQDANEVRLGYSVRPTVNLTGTEPNLLGNVTMPNWSTDLGTYTLNLINSPQDNLRVEGLFIGFFNDWVLDQYNPDSVNLGNGGNNTFNAKMAPGIFTEGFSAMAMYPGDKLESSTSLVAFRDGMVPTAATPVTKNLNLSTEVYGLVGSVQPTGSAPISVGWSANSLSCKDNPTPDAVITMVTGQVPSSPPALFGGTTTYNWVVMSRGDTASGVPLPTLDPAIGNTIWPEATFANVTAGIVFKADSTMSWDDWRNSEDNLGLFNYIPAGAATVCLGMGGSLNIN